MGRLRTDRTEPPLKDVFAAPIVRHRMESGSLTREKLSRNIEVVRKALLNWKKRTPENMR